LVVNSLTVQADLQCGNRMKRIDVNAGSSYFLHLQMPSSTDGLQYLHYTVTIQGGPQNP